MFQVGGVYSAFFEQAQQQADLFLLHLNHLAICFRAIRPKPIKPLQNEDERLRTAERGYVIGDALA